MAFVQELMDRDPLLVFGEGKHGVMDMFYAAARGGNAEVFKLLLDHAMSPRAVHAAAGGGSVEMLRELIERRSDVSEYLDFRGSTMLHAVAGYYLVIDFNINIKVALDHEKIDILRININIKKLLLIMRK
uniref:Uncharacterized protein n=1 Tax=Oryza nivara TaxID=4536 RepID=A0A0E0GS97_ORYNI